MYCFDRIILPAAVAVINTFHSNLGPSIDMITGFFGHWTGRFSFVSKLGPTGVGPLSIFAPNLDRGRKYWQDF